MASIFRANCIALHLLPADERDVAADYLSYCAGAIERILPHVRVSVWQQGPWRPASSVFISHRTKIRVIFAIGDRETPRSRSFTAIVERRLSANNIGNRTLDNREGDLCKLVVEGVREFADSTCKGTSVASLRAIRDIFDERVVAQHVRNHHNLDLDVAMVLESLHTLSEQSYENKALTFGCILDPDEDDEPTFGVFPQKFLEAKKYKALSDGFRTAYHVSSYGKVLQLADLEEYGSLAGQHYFPDWAELLASGSRRRKCGLALSRQGDILIFDEGSLRFTYRFGRWQYWNHAHLIRLLRDSARAQRVKPHILGNVVAAIYRAALDVAFRRSGALFVLLHNRNSLHKMVRRGDAIGDESRTDIDHEFDDVIRDQKIFWLPRRIIVELASLDGAVVLANSGRVLAYGAVLQPKKKGKLKGTEGSRTKAAIGASNYGLAVKISSDGDISIYSNGDEFITI